MKKLYTSLFLLAALLYSFTGLALQRETPQESASLYEHMIEVNAEWSHLNANDYSELVSFQNEDHRIQTHLLKVIEHLNANEPDGFSSIEIDTRRQLLGELSTYANAQEFPMNIHHKERTPYFIDHRGVHCAVGYLILQSGNGQLAQKISDEHNYDFIKDISTEGLTEWARDFGFTVDELKWIQPGYPPAQQMAPIGEGTNGPVTVMTDISTNNEVVFGGDFDMLDGLPCNQVGSWNGTQLSCMGNGVVGQINDISTASNHPYLAGLFEFEGDQYPLAQYDGGDWEYINIPERPDVMGAAVLKVGGFGVEAEVVIQLAEDDSELWYLMTNGTWELQCSFNGVVEKIKASSAGRVYAGAFNLVTIDGVEVEANNVIIKDNFGENWFTLEGAISGHIYAVEQLGEVLYLGGSGSTQEGESDVVLTRYLNGTLQTLISGDLTLNDVKYNGGAELILAGDLLFNDLGFTFGNHLATLDLISNAVVPLAVLNAPTYCISQFNNEMYFGGEFTEDNGVTVNHLGKTEDNSNSILEQSKAAIRLYPNPTSNLLNIELMGKSEAKLELISVSGQEVMSAVINSASGQSTQLDISHLDKGLYFLRVSQEGVVSTSKVVLE